MDATSARLRGRLAVQTRINPDDTATLDGLRRDLRVARLEDSIRRTVAAAPPLTTDQLATLRGLLTPAGGAA